MSKILIRNINEQSEIDIIEQIPQLLLCCFCNQMQDYQSFILHYANCKELFFNQEDIADASIKEDISRLNKMCSSVYRSIEEERSSLVAILELNKTAKGINSQLTSNANACTKCGTKVSLLNEQNHYKQCCSDSLDCSYSSLTTTNSSIIQCGSDGQQKKKRVKGVSMRLREFAEEEVKTFNSSYSLSH